MKNECLYIALIWLTLTYNFCWRHECVSQLFQVSIFFDIEGYSLLYSNVNLFIFLLFSKDDRSRSLSICDTLLS